MQFIPNMIINNDNLINKNTKNTQTQTQNNNCKTAELEAIQSHKARINKINKIT